MVSTRQSSNGGCGENSSTVSDAGSSKTIRHSNVQSPPMPEPSTSGTIVEVSTSKSINLMDLPPEILLNVLGYLPYRTVAHLRPVRKSLNLFCFIFIEKLNQKGQIV